MIYACSFDPSMTFKGAAAESTWALLSTNPASADRDVSLEPGEPSKAGAFFHVLDAPQVLGADDRRHQVPVGRILQASQIVRFRRDGRVGEIEGRLTLQTEDDAIIDLEYTGLLAFRGSGDDAMAAITPQRPIEATAWLVPVFTTGDSTYAWLAERGSVAFGASKISAKDDGVIAIDGAFDIYTCG
jgi:hypothetical protein